MTSWTIYDFATGGVNEIRAWIDSLPKAAQAKIDLRVRYLEATAVWPPQYISDRKDCDGIYELRIGCSGVEYRPLGFFGPSRRQFTLLLGAVEKGDQLEPRNFCTVATRRRLLINGNANYIVRHQFG